MVSLPASVVGPIHPSGSPSFFGLGRKRPDLSPEGLSKAAAKIRRPDLPPRLLESRNRLATLVQQRLAKAGRQGALNLEQRGPPAHVFRLEFGGARRD